VHRQRLSAAPQAPVRSSPENDESSRSLWIIHLKHSNTAEILQMRRTEGAMLSRAVSSPTRLTAPILIISNLPFTPCAPSPRLFATIPSRTVYAMTWHWLVSICGTCLQATGRPGITVADTMTISKSKVHGSRETRTSDAN
jgi:hypothetical protein